MRGTLGIGMGVIASPLLALSDRDFIPGAVAVAAIALKVGVVLRERAHEGRRWAGIALARTRARRYHRQCCGGADRTSVPGGAGRRQRPGRRGRVGEVVRFTIHLVRQ